MALVSRNTLMTAAVAVGIIVAIRKFWPGNPLGI